MSKKTFNRRTFSNNKNRSKHASSISRYRNFTNSEEDDKKGFDFTKYNHHLRMMLDDAIRVGGVKRLIERLSREVLSTSFMSVELEDKIKQNIEQFEDAKIRMAEICHPVVEQVFKNQKQEYKNILIPVATEADASTYNVSVKLKYTYDLVSMNVYDAAVHKAYRQEMEEAFQRFKARVQESSFITVSDVFHEEMARAKEVVLKRILTLHIPVPD